MTEVVKKKYYQIAGNRHVEVSLSYRLGGMNYFTGSQTSRGYYASVVPVEMAERTISFMAFSGYSVFVHPCGRRSPKQGQEALKKFNETPNIFEAIRRVLEKETAGFMFDEMVEEVKKDFQLATV
jgi:predicted transcriptional regulator